MGSLGKLGQTRRVAQPGTVAEQENPLAEKDDRLAPALKQARLAAAAHREALLSLADVEALRLRVLQEDVEEALVGQPLAAGLLDLSVVPGEPPRLWVDLISHVRLAEDGRTFQLIEEGRGEAALLFASADRDAMAGFVLRHMAHRMVARERLAAAMDRTRATVPAAGESPAREREDSSLRGGYSAAALVYAWVSGFALALILLGIAAILLEKLRF